MNGWSQRFMNPRNRRAVTEAVSAFLVGIGYLMEGVLDRLRRLRRKWQTHAYRPGSRLDENLKKIKRAVHCGSYIVITSKRRGPAQRSIKFNQGDGRHSVAVDLYHVAWLFVYYLQLLACLRKVDRYRILVAFKREGSLSDGTKSYIRDLGRRPWDCDPRAGLHLLQILPEAIQSDIEAQATFGLWQIRNGIFGI
ncbi:hypothetical protein EVAR_98760_1 [Eumeta japonica]|uniref:Uncharacterized protein n=1 Tax=Eumeta variegata TaxID=151549 RepID=A0A4C1YWL6_EUMVA|nr:hypothetical protein EVAR_98760_1 [Eumeta japonica]